MWEYNYTDELCHHGVKGMKWGVRRARARKQKREAGNVARLEKDRAKAKKKLDKAKTDSAKIKAQKKVDRLAKADPQVYGELKRNQRKNAVKLAAVGALKVYPYVNSPKGKAMIQAGKNVAKKSARVMANKVGDKFFDYAVLDASGKVLRRFN